MHLIVVLNNQLLVEIRYFEIVIGYEAFHFDKLKIHNFI